MCYIRSYKKNRVPLIATTLFQKKLESLMDDLFNNVYNR